jgi:hypothetical protein
MSDETYESRRKHVLMRRSADLGLRRVPGRPVWGVAMETGAEDGATTVLSTDDGAVSLLTSTGGGLHLTKDDWPYNAGTRLIGSAGDFLFECSPAWAYPLPEDGMIRFYLLTFDGVMTAEAHARELASGKHPLSDLFYAGHDVYALARLVSEDPNWMSYKPAIGRAVAPAEAPAEAPAAVDEAPPAEASPAGATGSDPMLRAAAKNDVDEVARLLAQGHDCGPNSKGITPLMAASHAGALEPLRLLLAAGVPVDIQDSHGYTALMIACNSGHDVCARLLLGAGADVQARDGEGFTSIMFAAKNGHDDIVRILMERGADPTATSDRGLSAVSLATQKGHAQTVSILLGR